MLLSSQPKLCAQNDPQNHIIKSEKNSKLIVQRNLKPFELLYTLTTLFEVSDDPAL